MLHAGSPLVSQSVSQSVRQSVSPSVRQSIRQSASQSVSQSVIPSVSQSVRQSVNKQSIYFEWHWQHHLLHTAINVTFSPFVLLHKYASFLEILNYASYSITAFLHSEIFTEVLTEMLKWFIAFVQHRRSSQVSPKPLNRLCLELFKPRTGLYTCEHVMKSNL